MIDNNLGEDVDSAEHVRQGDLTRGPILRTLLAFSLPTLFSNILQTLGGTINTIWVGQLLGEGALAATANANIVMMLIFAIIFGFGSATTVKVGQHFGARDMDGVRRVFGTGTGFCFLLSLAGAAGGWYLADPTLRLLATPPAIHDQALAYLRVIFLSMPFGTISMMISMTLRGAGDARTPLHAMILTTLLAIVLNPLLILGIGPFPQLGIAGAGVANLLASLLGTAAMVTLIYGRDMPLRLRGREFSYLIPSGKDLAFVLSKGMPMGAQMAITSAAGVIMVGLVNREGMLATAAFGACMQIWGYIQMPAFAIGTAVSAMAAQNIGADRHDRIARIATAGIIANLLMTGVLTALLMAFDAPLLSLFLGHGSAAIPVAEHVQLITTWSFVLTGVMMVLSGIMRAYGVVMLPLIAMVIAMYPARLGFYAIAYPHIGSEAVWWAYPAGSIAALVLTWLAYKWEMGKRHRSRALAVALAE